MKIALFSLALVLLGSGAVVLSKSPEGLRTLAEAQDKTPSLNLVSSADTDDTRFADRGK